MYLLKADSRSLRLCIGALSLLEALAKSRQFLMKTIPSYLITPVNRSLSNLGSDPPVLSP